MVAPETTRRALAALAAGRPFVDDPEDPATVVAAATDACERLDAAAAFVDDDGVTRLRAAVRTAERTDREAVAREGRRALATLARFRRAARGTDDGATAGPSTSRPRRDPAETESVKPAEAEGETR